MPWRHSVGTAFTWGMVSVALGEKMWLGSRRCPCFSEIFWRLGAGFGVLVLGVAIELGF